MISSGCALALFTFAPGHVLTAASPAPAAAAAAVAAAPGALAEAVMEGDRTLAKQLVKQGADVNATLGDGMSALHWAAKRGDADLAQVLLTAGANVKAVTRLGSFTPLHLASEVGNGPVITALLKAGAEANAATRSGTTPLMLAAQSGDVVSISALVSAGADVNAKETDRGHTPLLFAAAANRVPAVKFLMAHGADPNVATKVTDLTLLSKDGGNPDGRNLPAPVGRSGSGEAATPRTRVPGRDRNFLLNELVYSQGGMTPLLFAARDGYVDLAATLLDAGVSINQRKGGDETTPLLIATINGQFDLGSMLLDRGADPNLASENGVTPLYAAINVQWAPKALYPQPRAYLNQKLSYLEFMRKLLDKGANPNARLRKKVWYSGYNFDQSGVDEIGATAFWRAAYGADVEAMKLLVAHGADPNLPTMRPAGRPTVGDAGERKVDDVSGMPAVPVGGPGVPPLLAAAGVGYGEGFAGNAHRYAPGGLLAAVKYLVEELHADVNARDHEGNTAIHNAASRGDNEMIQYLVSKGADVKMVNRAGLTTVDIANGPVQRTQPYPETIALLEKMGVKNNHRCVSC